jgi:hypothetical protein
MSVTTVRPVFVFADSIAAFAVSKLSKGTPDIARVIWGKTLCSIGFHLDV